MASKKAGLPYRTEKRGGYSGGRPASTMGPPQKMPSGFIKPASNGDGKGASDKK